MLIIIAIGIATFPLIKILKAIIQKTNKEQEEGHAGKRWKKIYNEVLQEDWEYSASGKKIDIRNIPQLSFEQWLTFYNSSPDKWTVDIKHVDIGNEYTVEYVCVFPKYTKKKTEIFTFWKTPEDLWKFIEWQKNEYKNGDAAIFEIERAKELSKLAKCIKEDIAERTAQTKKELDALEKETIANMPQKAPEDQLHNFLNFQKQVYSGTFDKTKLERIYVERIMLSNGSIECKETYNYIDPTILSKPVKLVRKYIYNIKKENPTKEYIIHDEWYII